MYKELEKELKAIRRKKGVPNYYKLNESKSKVDKFHGENNLTADILYDRLTVLKRRIATFKLIVIPIYIAFVFGIHVALSFKIVSSLLKVKNAFSAHVNDVLNNAPLISSSESAQNIDIIHEIANEALSQYIFMIVVIVICLILIAALLAYCPYLLYRLNNYKSVVYEYEIKVIQHRLDALEKSNTSKHRTDDLEK